jgi:hypothetical protein
MTRRDRGASTVEWLVIAMVVGLGTVVAWKSLRDRIAGDTVYAGNCIEGTLGGGSCGGNGNGGARSTPPSAPSAWPSPSAPAASPSAPAPSAGSPSPSAPRGGAPTGPPITPVAWNGLSSDELIQSLPAAGPYADGLGPVIVVVARGEQLQGIDEGRIHPDPDSRLGAYAATAGYPPGTVGHGVHGAIGAIYLTLGETGQEQIGTVFNSPEAQAHMGHPITSGHSRAIAQLEYDYWRSVRANDWFSVGGQLGSAFPPGIRDDLQRWFDGHPPVNGR